MPKPKIKSAASLKLAAAILLLATTVSGCSKPLGASGGPAAAPTGKWGYINKTGNFIIQPQFDEASEFSENGAIVRDGKRLLRLKASPPGESSSPVKPDDVAAVSPLPSLIAADAGGDKYKVLDGAKVVFDAKTVPASDAVFHDNDFICARNGALYVFIDKEGNLGIPTSYKGARDFSDKRAAAMDNGKWGFINRKGSFVVPPKYLDAGSFAYGLAPVKMQMEVAPK